MKPNEKIVLNVGGLRFETYASTLQAFPGTKLCRLTEPQAATTSNYDPELKEFFFDRSSCLFEEVLNYYRTKHLHCPDLTCKSALDEELAFWGLSHAPLSPCCWQKLTIAEGQKEEFSIWEEDQEVAGLLDQAEGDQRPRRGQWRARVWAVFEKPCSSLSAKSLAAVSLLFNIGICVLFIAKAYEQIYYFPLYVTENHSNLTLFHAETAHAFYVHFSYLLYLELFCVIWFTCEFLLRFLSCPSKKKFLQSPLNVADFLSIWPTFIEVCLDGYRASHPRVLFWLGFFRALYFFKLLKVLKLVETPVMLRVLSYTSRAITREIITLLLVFAFEILFFGSLCYFGDLLADNSETYFTDIGSSFWWAVITLTTVGYGDVHPVSTVGKVIGACTALCGVLTIITPIPFFFIKFKGYYDAVMIKEKIKSKRKPARPLPS